MLTSLSTAGLYSAAAIIALIDVALVWLLVWRIKPDRFRRMRWPVAIGSAIFWGALGTIVIWGCWDVYYSAFYPAWMRWSFPLIALVYGLAGLAMWWLALRLPGKPILNFCLLGGLESLLEHLLGIYVLRILDIPILQGVTPLPVLAFAVFEYIFYWSLALGIAALLQGIWQRVRPDGAA